jgi:pyrimidine deaminase RibD-like protein
MRVIIASTDQEGIVKTKGFIYASAVGIQLTWTCKKHESESCLKDTKIRVLQRAAVDTASPMVIPESADW